MNNQEKIVEFCTKVKKGFGTIVDTIVKTEFERIYENRLEGEELATLLALLEKHDLLDKKRCTNSAPGFYQDMRKKMKESKI
jgi:hypothetical protein